METKLKWTLEEAVEFIRSLEESLNPKYHAGLIGSVLHKGHSAKDLDIVIYPKSSKRFDKQEIYNILDNFGLVQVFPRAKIKDIWEKQGSDDEKWVETWYYNRRRIDVFIMS